MAAHMTITDIAKNPAWAIIESMKWGERCHKRQAYNDIKKELVHEYYHNRGKLKQAREFVSQLVANLSNVLDTYKRTHGESCGMYGGDDSFSDMVHHVVGLGSEFYIKAIINPTILNNMNYVESFSYAWPDNQDFEMIDPHYHSEKAYIALGHLFKFMKENEELPHKTREIVHDLVQRFMALSNGDLLSATKGFDKKETYNHYYEWEENPCCAMFSNILKDAYDWCVKKD